MPFTFCEAVKVKRNGNFDTGYRQDEDRRTTGRWIEMARNRGRLSGCAFWHSLPHIPRPKLRPPQTCDPRRPRPAHPCLRSGLPPAWRSPSGPLSAPNSGASVNGQGVFVNNGAIAFPNATATGFDFGVDVEVSTAATVGRPLIVAQAVKRAAYY